MLQNIASGYLNGYSLGGSNTTSGTHIAASLVIAYFIFVFIVAVFYIICLWKVFIKASKPGWIAIIPLYNYGFFLKYLESQAGGRYLLFLP